MSDYRPPFFARNHFVGEVIRIIREYLLDFIGSHVVAGTVYIRRLYRANACPPACSNSVRRRFGQRAGKWTEGRTNAGSNS